MKPDVSDFLQKTRRMSAMPVNLMTLALEEARKAAERDEVPVGAVLVKANQIIASDGNRTRQLNDPTAHAEILVIREACRILKSERLNGADLYVTLEPCGMCATAISFARIRRLYIGALDAKMGAVENNARLYNQPGCHHAPDVFSGFQEEASRELLQRFFEQRR
jgi:tRNA(adenine34) deaminase